MIQISSPEGISYPEWYFSFSPPQYFFSIIVWIYSGVNSLSTIMLCICLKYYFYKNVCVWYVSVNLTFLTCAWYSCTPLIQAHQRMIFTLCYIYSAAFQPKCPLVQSHCIYISELHTLPTIIQLDIGFLFCASFPLVPIWLGSVWLDLTPFLGFWEPCRHWGS